MKKLIKLISSLFTVMVISYSLVPIPLFGQDQVRVVAGWEYGKFGDYWFTLKDGQKGDLV